MSSIMLASSSSSLTPGRGAFADVRSRCSFNANDRVLILFCYSVSSKCVCGMERASSCVSDNAGSNKGDQQRSACKVNRAARMHALRLRRMMNDAIAQLDSCGQVLEKRQRDRKSCAPSAFRPGVDFQCRGKRRVDWPIACSFCQQLARRGPLG